MRKILLFFIGFLFLTGLSSCKKDRLEDYFVKASENPDFFVMSLPANAVEIDKSQLDSETLKQIKSVKKINLLLYKKENGNKKGEKEFQKVQKILNHPKYKKLFVVNNEGRKLEFVYQGDPEAIDQITFLGRDAEGNFILGFVKAKKLTVNALYKALEHVKRIDNHHIAEFIDTYSKAHKPRE